MLPLEKETPLAKNLDVAGQNARCDEACKRVLSYKSILAWILKECVREYSGCDVKDIEEKYIEGSPQVSAWPVHPDEGAITGSNTEDSSINEGTVTYDIRFDALTPSGDGINKLIINLEAQARFNPGYSLVTRGVYYCARMLSAQYGKEFIHSEFGKIKKVYSIWICMNPPEDRQNTITHYRINEDNQVGEVREDEENYDLLNVTMVCLGKSQEKIYNRALRLLNVLLSSELPPSEKKEILQDEFAIKMVKQMEGDVLEMCNLSLGFEERGMEKGMKKGMAQGMAQGMERGLAKGRQEGQNQTIKKFLAAGIPAEKIAEIMNIPKKEIEEL